MKKLLLLLLFCVTSIYAKDFPDGLNNTKWKQTDLRDDKNYDVYEFSGRFFTIKQYENNRLKNSSTYKMVEYQNVEDMLIFWYKDDKNGNIYETKYDLKDFVIDGRILAVWYEDRVNPSVFEIRYDLKEYGDVVLISYYMDIKHSGFVQNFIPLTK